MAKKLKALQDLQPQRQNANRHTQRGLGLLEDSIQRDGWIGAITVAADGETFDGSARIEGGVAAGFNDAIVVESDGSKPVVLVRTDIPNADDLKAKRLGVAANRVAQVDLEWAPDVLAQLAEDGVKLDDLFSADELSELLADVKPEPGGGGDEFDTTPADGPTRCQPGDLWRLGKHRLLCGDSTKAEDVARLMGGEKAALVVTDPPYGVEYADKNAFLNAISRGNCIQERIEGDHETKEQTQAMWKAAFAQMSAAMAPGAVVYCFMPQGGDQMMMMMMMMGAGIEPRHELIWLKNNHVLGRVDYAYKHEPILYAWKEGGHKFYGGFQTSVIEINKPQASKLHPTMKPVELIERLMGNSSTNGAVVYDPFLGSGTTIIAAERLGRRCYGLEIAPKYCDVILRRAEAEGIAPIEQVA